jgi:hypothetical protein
MVCLGSAWKVPFIGTVADETRLADLFSSHPNADADLHLIRIFVSNARVGQFSYPQPTPFEQKTPSRRPSWLTERGNEAITRRLLKRRLVSPDS